jgi:hypothetical protein
MAENGGDKDLQEGLSVWFVDAGIFALSRGLSQRDATVGSGAAPVGAGGRQWRANCARTAG